MTLPELLRRLRASHRVRGVFTTGTTATGLGPASDIDLAVVLDRNDEGLRSVFTTVDDRFADIYVFDVPFVSRLMGTEPVRGNSWEGVFSARLASGRIEHDPDGVLARLMAHLKTSGIPGSVEATEQRVAWVKLNYDLATNMRYFKSQEPKYLRALEIRLLYGGVDVITAYFTFRGMAWQGEKAALAYFDNLDPGFGGALQHFLRAATIAERFSAYQALIGLVWHGEFQPWPSDFLVPQDAAGYYAPALAGIWQSLLGTGGVAGESGT